MWLMPTMGRPKMAKEAIDSFVSHGMKEQGVMWVDGDGGGYDFTLPSNWTRMGDGIRHGIGYPMNLMMELFPDEMCYGWLADDNYAETDDWCEKLEDTAGYWHMSIAYDKYLFDLPKHIQMVSRGSLFASAMCFGGNVIRTLGWWALPGLKQVGIDWVLGELFKDTGIVIYRGDVTVRHDHHSTGRREFDGTDAATNGTRRMMPDGTYEPLPRNEEYDADVKVARAYLNSPQYGSDRKKLMQAFKENVYRK